MSSVDHWDLMEGLGAACAVSSAVDSGILLALGAAPRSAAQIAAALELAADPTQLILDVLVAEGFAQSADGGYTAAPALARWLQGMPRLGLLPFRGLPSVLRGGDRAIEIDADPEVRSSTYRDTTPMLGELFAPPAAELAARLGRAGLVLDLGCGAGVWSLALARADDDATVVGVDFDGVLGAMRDRARDLGLSQRVGLVAADLRTDPLPRGFDTVILANVLRLERSDVASEMLRRAAETVAPGGRLVVVDALADETPAAQRSLALYALHLGLRTSRGSVHPRAHVQAWMHDAGFARVDLVRLCGGPAHLAALVGSRP
jgi:SAM-dependent methyltransferase